MTNPIEDSTDTDRDRVVYGADDQSNYTRPSVQLITECIPTAIMDMSGSNSLNMRPLFGGYAFQGK